jgi:radical SAM/Cys-rich protein
MTLSLHRRHHPLASAPAQRRHLEDLPLASRFQDKLDEAGLFPLRPLRIDTLQLNVGKLCNQTCRHCHVDAGPDRREVMGDAVLEASLRLLVEGDIPTLDITGGAPELHPRFREIIARSASAGRKVLHRCNLTALLLPDQRDLPQLLAEHRVEVVASLPYYMPRETDAQRGEGVFERSLQALRVLNQLGYGRAGSALVLTLVTNPVGAFLPAKQHELQGEWKRQLQRRHDIEFTRLFTITNMPISRFLEFLQDSGNLPGYMHRLVAAFNPAAAAGVMCRNLISVGWDGTLYDCDFNQMLELPVSSNGTPPTVLGAEPQLLMEALHARAIRVAPHCFGCTAGAGSSCGGAVA